MCTLDRELSPIPSKSVIASIEINKVRLIEFLIESMLLPELPPSSLIDCYE